MKLKAIVALLLLKVAGLQVSIAQVNHPYVDLALPSGTLWAAYNVGATSAEQPGTFFAWGETKGKTEYNRSTYQIGGELTHGYKNISKYVTKSEYGKDGITDNMSTLLPEDDAATANWGGDWVMPTLEQIGHPNLHLVIVGQNNLHVTVDQQASGLANDHFASQQLGHQILGVIMVFSDVVDNLIPDTLQILLAFTFQQFDFAEFLLLQRVTPWFHQIGRAHV